VRLAVACRAARGLRGGSDAHPPASGRGSASRRRGGSGRRRPISTPGLRARRRSTSRPSILAPRGWQASSATGSGCSPTRSPSRRFSTPIAPAARRQGASRARSSSRAASPGRRTRTRRSRTAASGRAPGRTSSTDDWHDPQAMYEHAERQVTDEEFKESVVILADPDQHAERIREIERAGRDDRRAQQLLRAAGNGGCPALRRARPPRPSGRSRRLRR
jgi:hypothetical protein